MAALGHLPLCAVITCLMLSMFSSNVSCASNGKVQVDLYYETLCPYCAKFMVNDLSKIFGNGLIQIINLNLVPYGNAKSNNGYITCQHGPNECLLNTVDACAINTWPNVYEHFYFVHCIENLVVLDKGSSWKSCFEKTGFDPNPIRDCYSGSKGKQLELRYANETGKLKPPHEFVPWVVVYGEPLRLDYKNFMVYVCKAYQGPIAPKACKNLTLKNAEGNNIKEVCHVEGGTVGAPQ